MNKKYKPKTDKLFWWLLVIVNAVCLPLLIIAFFDPVSLFVIVPIFLFVNYLMVSPLFGYAQLREDALYIKYGLILKKTIPYEKIRGMEIKRSIISESMMGLKLSLEHVVIKYNTFDCTEVGVRDNQAFIEELKEKTHR